MMMMDKTEMPTAEELLRKIQRLEEAHRLKYLIIKQKKKKKKKKNISSSPSSSIISFSSSAAHKHDDDHKSSAETIGDSDWTETQYMNILESMGRPVYMFDVNNRIVYWNQMAENLYGYTVSEALGKTPPDIIRVILKGETWSGQFPVRTKFGENFTVITTLSPCRHEENGTTFGVTCVCADPRPHFLHSPPTDHVPRMSMSSSTLTADDQPIQTASALVASKVKLKTKTGETNMDRDSHCSSTGTTDSNEGSENGPRLHKLLSLKAETWMGKMGISWPWKANENRDSSDIVRPTRVGWPRLHYKDQEQYSGPQTSSSASSKLERRLLYESPSDTKEAPGSYCGTSSSWSVDNNKTDFDTENLDVEILWDDLIIRQQIEQGSPGTVYHALLYGSDVAVKIFNKQEYPDDMIVSFRKEVFLMKRLRHPNILLFMGAVISPLHLCIVTEFLPRGSLFRLLQRSTTKLDWRRRVHMAMDIARGMNYLHHCQPPIIHCNLKSSNLLVDKNLTLKVGDFGLSRIKHKTYLATNSGAGTAQWMAPEVLRDEQVDEKSDVYSYGVVLWEITTGKIPWENLNSKQVIGAVGFMNQRLEIPNDVDPQWASLIESCWTRSLFPKLVEFKRSPEVNAKCWPLAREPRSRPTFEEILIKLKDLQKKFSRAPI